MPFCHSRFWSLLGVLVFTLLPSAARSQTDPALLSGLVIDDAKAKFTGEWKSSKGVRPYLGEAYQHDLGEGKGQKSAEFSFEVEEAGSYAVLLAYTPGGNRDPMYQGG